MVYLCVLCDYVLLFVLLMCLFYRVLLVCDCVSNVCVLCCWMYTVYLLFVFAFCFFSQLVCVLFVLGCVLYLHLVYHVWFALYVFVVGCL